MIYIYIHILVILYQCWKRDRGFFFKWKELLFIPSVARSEIDFLRFERKKTELKLLFISSGEMPYPLFALLKWTNFKETFQLACMGILLKYCPFQHNIISHASLLQIDSFAWHFLANFMEIGKEMSL